MTISVIGAGYVGLATCVSLVNSELNLYNYIVCADIDQNKIEALKSGSCPIHEPDMENNLFSKLKIEYSNNVSGCISNSDLIFVCVGTPLYDNSNTINTDYVSFVLSQIEANKKNSDVIVVLRSSVPIGFTRKAKEEYSIKNLLYFPEFLREGSAVADILSPNRIVVGTDDLIDKEVVQTAINVYAGNTSNCPIVISGYETAEIIKYGSNAMLAARVSFINELSQLCSAYSANIMSVSKGIGLDPRIGAHFLVPGPGFGGSCFEKDICGLEAAFNQNSGINSNLISSINKSNKLHMDFVANSIISNIKHGDKITFVGATFKAGTDDTRYSPIKYLINKLKVEFEIDISIYDPNMRDKDLDIYNNTDFVEACSGSNLIVIGTEDPNHFDLDWEAASYVVYRRLVIDLRYIMINYKNSLLSKFKYLTLVNQ